MRISTNPKTIMAAEIVYARRALRIKWKYLRFSTSRDRKVSKEILLASPRRVIHSTITLEMYTEENTDVIIPIISTVAKPLIGPCPKRNRKRPVMNVVRFESIMVAKALE